MERSSAPAASAGSADAERKADESAKAEGDRSTEAKADEPKADEPKKAEPVEEAPAATPLASRGGKSADDYMKVRRSLASRAVRRLNQSAQGGKVIVLFKATGNAPQLKQSKFKLSATARFQNVSDFLRKQLRRSPNEALFLFISALREAIECSAAHTSACGRCNISARARRNDCRSLSLVSQQRQVDL